VAISDLYGRDEMAQRVENILAGVVISGVFRTFCASS
jgi:hypothetical protein